MTRRIVDDQRIAGREKVRQIAHMRVRQIAFGADNQHPSAVPRIRGRERDAFGGENKIEGVDAHRGQRHPVEGVTLCRNKESGGCDPVPAPAASVAVISA